MIDRLTTIMARLRDPTTGCEWDSVQTFETIAPYTIEEAYEVADAIERGDMDDLKDELGDLLLQVVFHSRIAEEAGQFALPDVVNAISDKMERRHPHIFGPKENGAAEGGHHLWEQIKAEERAANADKSALAGVATGLPALLRAEKLQKRAARTGFDWPDASGPRAKIDEELAEVEAAMTPTEVEEEIGDLLFSVVNWARKLGVDPEAALRAANGKFERRFRAMETRAGDALADMELDALDALWTAAKAEIAITPAGPVFSREALTRQGFTGWLPFAALRQSACPASGGVYVVVYTGPDQPRFKDSSRGGWFKGNDPSVSAEVLASNWVNNAEVVYVGKGDQLRRRLLQFADFGDGKPVGHWGGRLIWQLAEPESLLVAWLPTPDRAPIDVEVELIATFRAEYGKPPFANDPHRLGR